MGFVVGLALARLVASFVLARTVRVIPAVRTLGDLLAVPDVSGLSAFLTAEITGAFRLLACMCCHGCSLDTRRAQPVGPRASAQDVGRMRIAPSECASVGPGCRTQGRHSLVVDDKSDPAHGGSAQPIAVRRIAAGRCQSRGHHEPCALGALESHIARLYSHGPRRGQVHEQMNRATCWPWLSSSLRPAVPRSSGAC